MVSKKSKTIIGFFVLGAIAIVCGIMIVLGTVSFSRNASYFSLYFNASLRGLTVGSSVYYNGVHVGKVVSMEIASSDNGMQFQTPVIIELNSPKEQVGIPDDSKLLQSMSTESNIDLLIENGLRAKLSTSSFITGLLVIDLVMDHHAAPVDLKKLTPYRGYPQIPTVESGIDSLLSSFSKIPIEAVSEQALTLLHTINTTLNEMQIANLSHNINELVTTLNTKLDPLLDNGNKTIITANSTMETVNSSLNQISGSLKTSLITLEQTLKNANSALKSIEQVADLGSDLLDDKSATMQELGKTMEALRLAALSIAELAQELEKRPNSLIFGKH